MKPPPFEYHRPDSLHEAVQLLARYGSNARVLAGGQSLLPLLALRRTRPGHIVDVKRLRELTGITHADGWLRIGAMTRHRDVERGGSVPRLVRRGVRHIGNVEVRNRGTVGGSLAFADPAAEWPALALAMGAVMVARSVRGQREISAGDLVVGEYTTSLSADELLVEVRIPSSDARSGFAEVTRRGVGDFALVGAVCHGTAVVVFGAGERPQRLSAVEQTVRTGRPTVELVELAASEIAATSDYRRKTAAALVGRVVTEMLGEQ